jgi:hypothetical protein
MPKRPVIVPVERKEQVTNPVHEAGPSGPPFLFHWHQPTHENSTLF